MKTLRWRTGRVIKLIILTLFLGMFVYAANFILWLYNESQCSEEESQLLIQEICTQYRNHQIAGNICSDLCDTHRIRYFKCTNYKKGKKVLFTECDNVCVKDRTVKAVLKTKSWDLNERDVLHWPTDARGSGGRLNDDGMKMAQTMFERTVYSSLRKQISGDDIFSFLWSLDFDDFVRNSKDPRSTEVALQSIWSLIQQDEYLFMKLHQQLPYIPKLYGTCGAYYLVEFAPAGDLLDPKVLRTRPSPWRDRAKIALQLLELTRSVDSDFYEPLHICDIKEENFGIDRDKVVKFIDLDTVFFHTDMMGHLANARCTSHERCDFFDCRGWCNISTNTCTPQRTNNNIQNVCEDILIDRAQNFYSGLLYYPPSSVRKELTEILKKCAYPRDSMGTIVREKTPDEVYWDLYNLLRNAVLNPDKTEA